MTVADLVIVATLVVSGLLAMLRGFTLEFLSITAFAIAALIALVTLPLIRPLLHGLFPSEWMTATAGLGIVFFIALIPLWYAGDKLAHKVRKSSVGAIDRSAGFVFGVARGLFVLAIAYIIVDGFGGVAEARPKWLDDRHGQLMPLIKETADLLLKVAPDVVPKGAHDGKFRMGRSDRGFDQGRVGLPVGDIDLVPRDTLYAGSVPH